MVRLKWVYSTADDAVLPRKGFNLDFDTKWFLEAPGAAAEFGLIDNKLLWNIPIARRDSLFVLVAGGASLAGDPPLMQQFKLGGAFQLGAYRFNQFHDRNYLLGSIGYLKFWGKLPLTGRDLYATAFVENGNVFDHWQDLEMHHDLSLGFISSTLLGPIYLGASFGDDGNVGFNFTLGHIF